MNNRKIIFYLNLICICVTIYGCTENYIPRDKAYPRIQFPKQTYVNYVSSCPYEFEYPSYARIEEKNTFFNRDLKNDSCWINIDLRELNGKIHLSYKHIAHPDTLYKLMEDAYKLTSKHTLKADYIKDSIIDEEHLKGIWYDVGGNAASSVQFFLTDEKHHYLRGALYFTVTPNIDSMSPIINFVKEDIRHLIHTFKWK